MTTVDPVTALLVIDLQSGTTANPSAHPVETVVGNSVRLIDAFRARELPVVLVTMRLRHTTQRTDSSRPFVEPPTTWSELVTDVVPAGTDILLTKSTWGAFAGTGLDDRLRSLGVTQVVIVGLATSFGIESTAREAYDLGYTVTLPIDAMTDPRSEAHDNSVTRIFPALGETGSTEDVLRAL